MLKQIRSGQSFLYRINGYDSTVVEVRMRDKVTGSYLQAALTNTALPLPYTKDGGKGRRVLPAPK